MTLNIKKWGDLTEDELREQGNYEVTVVLRRSMVTLNGVQTEELYPFTCLTAGWFENPQTHSLSLRRRVSVEAGDEPEILLVEWKLFGPGEWVSIEAATFMWDPEGMAEQRRQREEQAALQAEMQRQQAMANRGVVTPGGPNRQQRRAGAGL